MYPYLRVIKLFATTPRKPKSGITELNIKKMTVMPGDIDVFMELNNGRFLTLMDFGRFDVAIRTGFLKQIRKENWGLTVAGASVRFRYRLRLFQRFELHSQIIGRDEKWIYFHQKIVRKGKIHASALIRTGVTSPKGIVRTDEVVRKLKIQTEIPPLPGWAQAWVEADELHPK